MKGRKMMDRKMYNTWMTVTGLVLGILGLLFILVSIFDANATKSVLTVGLLFIALGNLFNVIRMRQNRKAREEKEEQEKEL